VPRLDDYMNFRAPLISEARLTGIARAHVDAYRNATPFPHVVLDDLFDAQLLDHVVGRFPGNHGIRWRRYDNEMEDKLASRDETQIDPFIRYFLYTLNSAPFLRFLQALTGIRALIPDPHFEGGGLHKILPGGRLAIHADFNKHRAFDLDRRLNLLLYLNRDWKDEYGGHLELWDFEANRCVRRIAPEFNRTVIFSTTDVAMHGHPEPLRCPSGQSRQSIALYYYSNGRAREEESAAHSTLFRERPDERFQLTRRQRLRRLLPKPMRRYL